MVTRELQKEQLSWYESNLPLGERKKRGHFSTPPTLVKSILDACGYTPEVNLTKIRVLDPACGSGNFLVGAAQRLAAFGRRMALTQAEHTALISQNLWGLDPDPVACFLAEMQLRALLEDADTQLHIHQADALALPWEACVDLFVTNPPYLAAKNNDLSGYRTAQRGQSDSYLLFLSLALQVVRPNGWVGLVLPDPLLARSNAATERARLLEEFTIHHLWHLSGVFTAEVGAVVIVAQKKSSQPLHHISWLRERWQSISKPQEGQAKTVSQALFLRQPSAEFRYLLSSERGAAVEQLRAHLENATNESRYFAPLQAFLSIARGEELGRESPYLTQNVVSANNSEPGWEDKAGRLLPGGQGRLAGRLLPGGQGRLAGRPQGSPLPYTRYGESIVYGGGDPCGPYTGRFFRGEGQRGGGTEGTRKQSTPQAFSDEVGSQQGGGTEGTRKQSTPQAFSDEVGGQQGGGTEGTRKQGTPQAFSDEVGDQQGEGTEGTRKQSTPQAFSDEVGGQQGGGTEGTRKGPPTAPSHPCLYKQPTTSETHIHVSTCGWPGLLDDISPAFYPVLRGGVDIHPYSTPRTNWWIAREGIKKSLERYLSPKLLVVKSTGRLQATLDMQGHVALQTLYLLHLRQKDTGEDSLYFFLALLNSRLLRDYVHVLHTAYKWVQPQIEQHVLAKLPIPIVGHSEKQQIIERAKLLMSAYSDPDVSIECKEDIDRMYEEQENAICALYGFV